MEQQQWVEYTHVTDHMVMHCVRLLATLGKFKVHQQHNTNRNALFLRCKPALCPGYCDPRVFIKSLHRGRSHCLPEYANRRISPAVCNPYRERHWCSEMKGTLPESAACQAKEWLRFTLIVSALPRILRQMTEICCRLGCDTMQLGSLINVAEASTKEAVSSNTLVPTSRKSVFSKEIFVNLRRDAVSTERKDACYTNSINLLMFALVNFHCRLQKSKR